MDKGIRKEIMKQAGKVYKSFYLPAQLEDNYDLLYHYFHGFKSESYDLEKGLLILGPVGTGKSVAMQIFGRILSNGFALIATRHVVREFNDVGMSILDRYGRHSFRLSPGGTPMKDKPIIYCFDDIGLEDTNSQLYGNKANVMAEILLDRYEMFKHHQMLTHATTNLTLEQITDLYGNRIADRLKEMVNVIVFKGESMRL